MMFDFDPNDAAFLRFSRSSSGVHEVLEASPGRITVDGHTQWSSDWVGVLTGGGEAKTYSTNDCPPLMVFLSEVAKPRTVSFHLPYVSLPSDAPSPPPLHGPVYEISGGVSGGRASYSVYDGELVDAFEQLLVDLPGCQPIASNQQ